MAFLVTTPAQLQLFARAVNVLAGLKQPVRGVTFGGPDFVPREYIGIGTPGWTDSVYRGSWVSADLSQAAIAITPELLGFAGMGVVVDDQLVEFPDESAAVAELPPALTPEGGAFWWSGEDLETEGPTQ